jgi:predicted permease
MLFDLKFAFRSLKKSPSFTLIAVLTLALGIGACTAMFSVANALLLKPLPYPRPDRLVFASETGPNGGYLGVAPATYLSWQEQARSFDSITAWDFRSYNITGEGSPFRVFTQTVSVNFFSTLGIQPQYGRNFLPEDGTEGKSNVVILSNRVWKSRFGARSEVLGKSVMLDDAVFTVIGVMPDSYQQETRGDVFTPLAFSAVSHVNYQRTFTVIGRLKADASLTQAAAELKLVAENQAKTSPANYKNHSAVILTMREYTTGGVKTMALLLLAAVASLLLIACTNIANLLLARASLRQREMAVRTALGASRGTIIRQLLVESLLLAALGGVLGLVIGLWSLDLIITLLPPAFPRTGEITLDGTVMAVTGALTLLSGLFFGLIPALQASQVDLNSTLKTGGNRGASEGRSSQRLRSILVVAEIALALILLSSAGLFLRSLTKLQNNETGFDGNDAYMTPLLLADKKYPTEQQRMLVTDQFLERIAQVPGVTAVAFTNHTVPAQGAPSSRFSIVGQPPVDPQQQPRTIYFGVTPDYFKALKVPLIRGRFFTSADGVGAPRVVLINEELAKKYFADGDPLGKQITLLDQRGIGPREIVGIVANVRQYSLFSPFLPQVYEPYAQVPELSATLIVRTHGTPLNLPAVTAAIHAVDPTIPFEAMFPMADGMLKTLGGYDVTVKLLTVFSGIALFLAALGIYGVMAYNVSQRTTEIGIRMALGAQRGDVITLVLRQSIHVIGLGLLIGLAGSFALTRLLSSQLYETSPYDPLTMISITIILALVALAACIIPARRATRVNPMVALRAE